MEGDAYAQEVMLETAKILGAGIANLVNLFNPDVVVLVGGVTQGRGAPARSAPLRSPAPGVFVGGAGALTIVPGELPETAGVIGAVGVFAAESA